MVSCAAAWCLCFFEAARMGIKEMEESRMTKSSFFIWGR